MTLLNQNTTIQSSLNAENIPLGAMMFVYAAGTDSLMPVYEDPSLTSTQANPLTADATGRFDLCYVRDGLYRIEVRRPNDRVLFSNDNVVVRSSMTVGATSNFMTVASMLADTWLSYSTGKGRIRVVPGEVISVAEGGFSYKVAASDADDFHVQTAGGIKFYTQKREGEFVDRQFGVIADGLTDETEIYQGIAAILAPGDTLRIAGAGARILSDEVIFPQDDLSILSDRGVTFRKAANTQGLDRVFTLSGDRVFVRGGEWDGNIAGNPAPVTGRGELLRITGDHGRLEGVTIRDVQDVSLACGIIISGRHTQVKDTTSYNTGRMVIRDAGDFTIIDGLRAFDMFENRAGLPAAQRSSSKGIVKDNAPGGQPFNRAEYRNIYCESRQDGTDYWCSAVLVDHNGVQGGYVLVENVRINFPNFASYAADAIKFAYVDTVELRGFRGTHGGNARVTLRIQQDVASVLLDDCILPGTIAFDATMPCDMTIEGNSVIGDAHADISILRFIGNLVVKDGSRFSNVRSRVVSFRSDAYTSTAHFGRIHLSGAGLDTPTLVTLPSFGGTSARQQAGNISVRRPLSVSGGFRTLENHGRWVTQNEDQEITIAQTGDRIFLATASTFPPGAGDGWRIGDIIRRRNSVAGQSEAEFWCVRAGSAEQTAWAANTGYQEGDRVYHNDNVYTCTTAGTSDVASGPTGTGTGIADGSAVWSHVAPLALFRAVGTIAP